MISIGRADFSEPPHDGGLLKLEVAALLSITYSMLNPFIYKYSALHGVAQSSTDGWKKLCGPKMS